MLYHPDFEKNLYLMTDASNVGCGSFLYQIDAYPRSEEGMQQMMENIGFIPEQLNTQFLIPGVSPGKKTPIVTDFMNTEQNLSEFDTWSLPEWS